MKRKTAQHVRARIQDAGDNTARMVHRGGDGWQVSTSSGTVRSPFDWYYTQARLKSVLRGLKRLKQRL